MPAENVDNYSVGGLTGAKNFFTGNDVGNILFGDKSEGTGGLLIGEGVHQGFKAGVGTVMTAGRRTASITSMNIKGARGPAARILAKTGAEEIAGVVSGVVEAKLAVDLGLAAAEVVGCTMRR